ncbi:hypothetical protein [Chlorobium sp. KB01]|uniref:hypothetical protein n=1 Tax=Chlorobium sp. KB01 TaxID=1917528 RepID=UPI000975FCFA|nr:hypothetical protein [Chlorobium sp. KB01]
MTKPPEIEAKAAPTPQRIETVKKLYDLWTADNQMLNTKLSQLFVVNSLLLAVLSLSLNGKAPGLIPVACLFGLAFSALCFFSLRRTLAYRAWYRKKLVAMCGDDALPYLLPTAEDEQREFAPTARIASHVPGYVLSVVSCIAWVVGLVVWLVR